MGGQINVIYLLGCGHSGSTMLDRILGAHEKIVSVGELSFYNIYRDKLPSSKINKISKYQCSCGQNLETCSFWAPIVEKDGGKIKIKKKYSSQENFWYLAKAISPTFSKQPFSNADYDLFSYIQDTYKPAYILDTSKDPRRLIDLARDPRINLKVIYNIRDGRSVAYSYMSPKRDELGVKKRAYTVSLAEWIFVNFSARSLVRKLGVPSVTLSYKQFCEQPQQELDRIGDMLGLRLDAGDYTVNHHSICGNVHVLANKEIVIKYQEEWKEKTPRAKLVWGTVVLRPFKRWLI